MIRKLKVFVDSSTWPGVGLLPGFPPTFTAGVSEYDINIPAMLLKIGYLTTPTSSTGVSLSEFWAWVRYLSAITNEPDMRITSRFADLDAHQKTILSDDFGMGVPMLWLTDALSLKRTVDGNYFIQKMAASLNIKRVKSGKRGPDKTPDFVAEDIHGIWHVVECKGTQSGVDYCDKQLGLKGKAGTGGIVQKRSIIFPAGHTGQRLACGLSIGLEAKSSSVLKIVDPEPEDPFSINKNEMEYANDAIMRGVISKLLRLSGLEVTAERIAAPLGRTASVTRFSSRTAESRRNELVSDRELKSHKEMSEFLNVLKKKEVYHGRERTIYLPREIFVDGRVISKVVIKQKINSDFISMLATTDLTEEPIDSLVHGLDNMLQAETITSGEFSAEVSFGSVLKAELILE